jgi:hypothetical protein
MNNDIQFGCLNVDTGEFRKGHIDKSGNQQFKRLPWYKRLFFREPSQTELVGTTTLSVGFIWTRDTDLKDVKAALYRKFNPYAGKTQKIWAKQNGNTENKQLVIN